MIKLWSSPSVPKAGWDCLEVEDLGYPGHRCVMCGNEAVRYVHHMAHRVYIPVLQVGCVCASHMAAGYDAKAAEREIRNLASRRKRAQERREAFSLEEWKRSQGGNETKILGGQRLVITRRSGGFALSSTPPLGWGSWETVGVYASPEQARAEAFTLYHPQAEALRMSLKKRVCAPLPALEPGIDLVLWGCGELGELQAPFTVTITDALDFRDIRCECRPDAWPDQPGLTAQWLSDRRLSDAQTERLIAGVLIPLEAD